MLARLEELYTALSIPHSPAGEKLRSLGKITEAAKGKILPLYRNGEALLYILLSGCTCCESETPDGRGILGRICYRTFDVVNPVEMFTGNLGNERCICLADSAFAIFPLQEVMELVQKDMGLMRIYAEHLCKALGEQARLKYMLSLRSEEKYVWFLSNYGDTAEQIPLRIVAQFLGMDPATLSRIRQKMKNRVDGKE